MDPVELFRRTAATVPAYRAFLAAHAIDPAQVTNLRGFSRLPMTTKDTYTRRHPLPDLCRDGTIGDMIAVSSGSTGTPSFWPRSAEDERAVSARFEEIFRDAFDARGKRTLAVVCFALGTWLGRRPVHPRLPAPPGCHRARWYLVRLISGRTPLSRHAGYRRGADGGRSPRVGRGIKALRSPVPARVPCLTTFSR
ncbi:hypothetical protein AB0B45_18225 [Nonomuraea sp. NPDC049152]|uniref:hypothetical protein n=1 Tax=Nonomuraea sp. NPDC049152 TaxID=3154350 RepID=UPI0033D32DBA